MHTENGDGGELTAWALTRAASGIEVLDAEVAALEEGYLEQRADRRSTSRRGARASHRGLLLVALASAAALALALAALLAARGAASAGPGRDADSVSASGLTGLAGLWRVESDDAWPPLWVVGPDGSLEVLAPADLVRSATGREAVERGRIVPVGPHQLALTDSAGCTALFRTERLDVDRLRLDWLSTDADCDGQLGPERGWATSLVRRVAPSSSPVTSSYVAGTPELVRWDSALTGTWVLRGSGRVLSIAEVTGSALRYVAIDDIAGLSASGRRLVAEQGTVRIGVGGAVALLPDGSGCDRSYRIRATYAALDARLDPDSCGRLGDAADTWIRVL